MKTCRTCKQKRKILTSTKQVERMETQTNVTPNAKSAQKQESKLQTKPTQTGLVIAIYAVITALLG